MSILDNHKKYQTMTSSNLSVATVQSPENKRTWGVTDDLRCQGLVECAGSVHELRTILGYLGVSKLIEGGDYSQPKYYPILAT